MTLYARVAVNIPRLTGVFDYHLPPDLAGQVQPGCLVEVPFGKQAVQGVVLDLASETSLLETRPVTSLLDPRPALTPAQLSLALWLAAETLTPLAACLDAMLPPGLSQQADTLYRLNPSPLARGSVEDLSPLQKRILALLKKRGDLRGRQLEAAFPHQIWKDSAQGLIRRGFVSSRAVLPPPSVRPKLVRTVLLACPPAEIDRRLEQVARKDTAAFTRRQKMLAFLVNEPWPVDVTWVYAAAGGGTLADLEKLAEAGLVLLSENEIWRDPLENVNPGRDVPPDLTADQSAAWEGLLSGLAATARGESVSPYLLRGVTGSGKTELYLRAVQETLRQGRQALILVPEISLTPQTVRRFLARFPGQVGLVHSRLSPGERYDTWRRARAGDLPVIVGPRSALFTPLPDPGLIVLDECHDDSYFQDENQPYYHAVETALQLGRLSRAVVLLGSATPGVGQVYRAGREGWQVLTLPHRIAAHRHAAQANLAEIGLSLPEPAGGSLDLPPVTLVDMRSELKNGNRSIFSLPLQDGLRRVLALGQQAILFLNRRGNATYVFCRDCGESVKCPRCEIPLTQHLGGGERLVCHHCNYTRQVPKKCPTCNSPNIRMYGTGTEKVENDLLALLPQARVLRWDAETAREKGAHEILLSHFSRHQADILIGTQMLAKGLDLPLVTLVGVILADVGLNFPDYRAGERTFQLLTQVAGRAGRSPLGGEVILQTFQPDHYAVQAAARYDFDGFNDRELAYRRKLIYPPFARLVKLEYRHSNAAEAERSARAAADLLNHWIERESYTSTSLVGPVPCFFGRYNSQYRWQVLVRGPDPVPLVRAHLDDLPAAGLTVQVDPASLL